MLVHDRHVWRLLSGIVVGILILAAFAWSSLPLQDQPSYFNFADQRMMLGIPNFYDVISNLLFIYVGLWGMLNSFSWLWARRPKPIMIALLAMNFSVFLTGWGSSYFHMSPTADTLFWDRAPMAMGFMALLVLLLSDRAPSMLWQVLLMPFMALGVYVAWIGSFSGDIRYYIVLQGGALLSVLLLLIFRKAKFINNKMMVVAFVLYFFAKWLELSDHLVYDSGYLSGHTLKHLLAALSILFVNIAVFVPVKHRF